MIDPKVLETQEI